MRFLALLVNRPIRFVPTVPGLMAITFAISHVIPADPVAFPAGENATAEQIAALRARHGFDRPMPVQLRTSMIGVLQGDFGVSLHTRRPISEDLLSRMPATVEPTVVPVIVAAGLGIPLGVIAAVRRNAPLDHVLRILTVSGLAIASFWLAILFQLFFATEPGLTPLQGRIDGWGPDPITGFFLIDGAIMGDRERFRTALHHMVLPVATPAFPAMATILRFTRAGLPDAINANCVLCELAMGLPRRVVIWKHVLRNALIGTVTRIGLIFGILIAGAVVVEAVFDRPGLGLYAVQSILNSDCNAIMGFTLLTGAPFILVNLAVDIVHGLIDPGTQG